MKFCEECGAQLDDDVKFCEECGTPVASPEEEESIIYETPVIQKQTKVKKELGIKRFEVKKYLVPTIAGVVLLFVVGIGIVIFGGDKNTNEPITNNTSTENFSDDVTENSKDTMVGENSEVDTEGESESATENLGMSKDEYILFEDFVNAVSTFADWPSEGTQEELLTYQKEEYRNWRNGEGWEGIVIAEDGHAYCELFMGAPYGVYIINGYENGLEYAFYIEKQNSVYKATYIEQYNNQNASCTFEITDAYVCSAKDNTMQCKVEGENSVTVHVNFYTYNASWSECNFKFVLEYADGTVYEQINTVISSENTTYATFNTYDELYYFMTN